MMLASILRAIRRDFSNIPNMRILTALPFLSLAAAHTVFTTLYVDGENQGDGVCVRMNQDPAKVNFPVEPLSSKDIACGTVYLEYLECNWC